MTTTARAFVDTNVLLRAFIDTLPLHEEAQQLILSQRQQGVELWVSRQVIREYLVNVTRPQQFMNPLTVSEVETQVEIIESLFQIADDTAQTTRQLVALLKDYAIGGKQIHDANIVATMLIYEIDRLLTHNIKDFRRFESQITLIPLLATPNSG